MENEVTRTEEYDYRQYDRIWKRVSPELDPYPDVRAAVREEPEEEMCCMKGGTADMVSLLAACIDGEVADRCAYLHYARCAPHYARRCLQQLAADEERHARRLLSVYYLTTGQCHRPAIPTCPCDVPAWCPLLRQLYHRENCGAERYEQGAAGMTDACLQEIFAELAAEERRHARQILQLLEKTALA